MMISIVPLAIISAAAYFSLHRLRSYMRYFQQEEYNSIRFSEWLLTNGAYDTKGVRISVVALFCVILSFAIPGSDSLIVASSLIGAALLTLTVKIEGDPRHVGKVRLNLTNRARKIIGLGAAITAVELLMLVGISTTSYLALGFQFQVASIWICLPIIFTLTPHNLSLANRILSPFERSVQEGFLDDAKLRFKRAKPFTIGITGSYGKTSTKSILGQIMELAVGPTYWPQKGINTLMGMTRNIRERLHPGYPFAILEIGAYGIGSIRNVCEHFPIDAAIVTAVGVMHLERFGSEENIFKAKSELAQAVPRTGILVVNGDNPGARRMAAENPKAVTLIYGTREDFGKVDCLGSPMSLTENGMTFSVKWREREYKIATPLLGSAAQSNILGAFTMACALGGDPEVIALALANLEQVDNRLVRNKAGEVTYLQDAYNSNPTGFRQALEVLRLTPGKRRILMTPGMIELGRLQSTENAAVAKEAATVCDLAVIVGSVNREHLVAGLTDGGLSPEKLKICDTREEAFSFLKSVQQDGDVVLIENDLPDLYEGELRF